jgi:CheY-like chemotaxis protein/GAF domain-containing protein
VPERPRILILGQAATTPDWLAHSRPDAEFVHVASWGEALGRLHAEAFDAVVADTSMREPAADLLQAERVLAAVPVGIAVVDFDLRIRWANRAFQAWCDGPAAGRGFYEALGCPPGAGGDFCPFQSALAAGAMVKTRLQCGGNRYLELDVTPLHDPRASAPLLLAVGHDVTARVAGQQKLDALHRAGRALAALAPDQLADMSAAERVELLKVNVRRFTRDLLHYEVIEIRLLDRATGRLELLLQDGMMPDASTRTLEARTEGQGVTGYVAVTGKSYLCGDTTLDPRYLPGAAGARSSLTVPLVYEDEVIGTLNVERPEPNAFSEEDLQFTELFGHEIAAALHTLELLSAEKSSTASQSVEAISREVAMPVDDILTAATSVLERYIGHDAEMADKLRQILQSARAIKATIQKVGEDIAPAPPRPAGQPIPPSNLKGLRVLVADGDERVRRSAHALLGRWGCIVETARDGREALTMARLGTYDAVLADIRLPDIGGYEAYRQLRAAQPEARVILMTGYGYDRDHTLVKARQDGLRHVLFKPFRVDQLRTALSDPDAGDRKQEAEGRRQGSEEVKT